MTANLVTGDVDRTVADAGSPLLEFHVGSVVSRDAPPVTVSPEATGRPAVRASARGERREAPVVDGIDLVGILTHVDVVDAHPMVPREAIRHEWRRAGWEGAEDGQ